MRGRRTAESIWTGDNAVFPVYICRIISIIEHPREQIDAVSLESFDFRIKSRYVPFAPRVGEMLEPQLFQHPGTLFGVTLFGIKGRDSPSEQVFLRPKTATHRLPVSL